MRTLNRAKIKGEALDEYSIKGSESWDVPIPPVNLKFLKEIVKGVVLSWITNFGLIVWFAPSVNEFLNWSTSQINFEQVGLIV